MTGRGISRRDLLAGAGGMLALGTALGLAGCSTDVATGASSGTPLQLWSQLAGSKAAAGSALQTAFAKADPRIDLAVSLYGNPDQLNQKLLTGFVGGILPDLYIQHWDYSLVYASGGKLEDLGDVVRAAGIDPVFADYGTLDGKVVTVPLYGTSRALTINTDLVEAAGLDATRPPTSWAELREWARTLVRFDGGALKVAGLQIYSNDLELFEAFTLLIQGAGGSVLNEDASDIAFDSDAGVAAATFLRELIVEDRVTVPGFGIGDSAAAPFYSGRAAMAINGNYAITQAQAAKVKFAVAKMPKRDSGYTSLVDPFCFGIPVGSAHADAALDFVRFALRPDSQAAFASTSVNIPAVQSARSAPSVAKNTALAAFADAATYAPHGAPTSPSYDRMLLTLSRALQSMFFSDVTPSAAIRSAAQQTRPFIREGARP